MTPSFSIVLPLYNQRALVGRALDSILAQGETLEALVVDDGSTDGGGGWVRSTYRRHPVRVLHQKNAGVSAARNRGIRAAQAPYVGFLDPDDEFAPGYLPAIRSLIQKFPQAGTFATGHFIQSRRSRRAVSHPALPPGFEGLLPDPLRLFLSGFPMHISSTVVRRQVLKRVGPFPKAMRNGEDLDLYVRLALDSPVAFLQRPLTLYYRTGISGSFANGLNSAPFLDTIRRALAAKDLGPTDREALREHANFIRIYEARILLETGEKARARALLRKVPTTFYRKRKLLLLALSHLPFNALAIRRAVLQSL